MKCKKCKKLIPDGSKFCNHCGAPTSQKKLYRRKDGLYEKIIKIDGKRVAFRAQKEADVYKKISEYEAKKEAGPLFIDVAEEWHTEHWESLSPTTQQGYQFPFDEIKDYFKDEYIKDITHKDINRYIKQLPATYARKTCSNRLNILNMIFKYAVIEEYVDDNPCTYISIPKTHGSKKRRAPTSDEMKIINKSIGVEFKSFPVGFLAVFLLYTGCRKGEALALQFKDIDLNSKRIYITKSVYYVNNEGKLKPPKTEAGNREIIIPDILVELLPKGKKNDFLFCIKPGTVLKKDFFDKAWDFWRKKTGLSLTAHQLRHGYATLLHEANVDVKDAQDQLGHADASTTQNTYTEVSSNRRAVVAEKINSYLQ